MGKIERFYNYSKENGLKNALKLTIRLIYADNFRWILPYKIAVYNGVIVRDCPPNNPFSPTHDLEDHVSGLWSNIIHRKPFVYKDYEKPLIDSIRKHAGVGDDVIVIGGGRGGTTVAAARQVGENGSVTTYEAAEEKVNICKETIYLNNVEHICDIRASIVGKSENISGDPVDVSIVPTEDLSECDILEMDCEGAELLILEELDIRPRVLIVETHGATDPLDNEVAELLNNMDYEIVETGIENLKAGCYILTAKKPDQSK
jgi:hypothetical protein